ncbi:pro-corazonin [Neodiprion pinetum]|uniref:Pro-corazonin n=1 Tax=Neodiprion lecontei TaxID=441921 RepID=A0A6J0C2N3_NEOLC|nr:pro-corazonin [Neodiprion lecontei]XP_046433964.1 pro-corazonin-like [Neodiprion fabricii]XP_046433972.1 pro-corazonin-like [Neodiprion fabricii]XP_046433982.1 pro-corazonin-like [Neodiprion fabricii]XP_046493141.1 pro-corazonin-like [Neodiprion pinetum]XP_046493143.1 pro-corazonin-like [Neodiprion pinetum]XP_046493144.1 pro-corazonin-like [Neodiprion pinetum]XP_046591808.1 pro-corazonin [Neodiprion lecontei]XP_046591814.1 pro-corazonin [Neodiprion lecontei]XP_046609924.1 pro-corazonin-
MTRSMTLAICFVSMMALSLAQTFQYSRGWTNGKRSGHPFQGLGGLPSEFGAASAGGEATGSQIVDLPTPCQLQKLKILLRGTAGTDQMYLLPCEVIGNSGLPSSPDFAPAGRFRRSSNPQENNDSY